MKIFVTAFCILIASHTFSQDAVENNRYNLAISFIPSALAQPDHTFLSGGEKFFSRQLSVSMDVGFIFSAGRYQNSQAPERDRSTGFIIRPSIKVYTSPKNRFYFQPQVFYKQVMLKQYNWLGMNCVNNVPAYEEFRQFRERRIVRGYNLCIGYVAPFSAGRFFVDIYTGFGVRYRHFKIVDVPNACYNRPVGRLDFGINSEGSAPSLPGGIRLLLKLGKQN